MVQLLTDTPPDVEPDLRAGGTPVLCRRMAGGGHAKRFREKFMV